MATETAVHDSVRSGVLDITGMTCSACVRRVERALQKLPGVAAATVNLATHQASVEFDPDRVQRDDLTAAVVAAGYGVLAPATPETPVATGRSEHEQKERRMIRRDLTVATAATVPLLVLGMSHGAIPFADNDLGRVVQFALGSIVLFGPGLRFLRGGLAAVRHRNPDMNTLVALGALTAWLWSTVATFAPQWFVHGGHVAPHIYFEAGAAIIAFVLFGKYLEMRARWRLGDAVRALHALVPDLAHRVDGASTSPDQDVPVASLRPGDVVRVRPGERVPSDGVVVHGQSAVDESLLSGESAPVDKAQGDKVVGGSMNAAGALLVRIERTGADTALARIATAVEQAQGSRAPIARFADRASGVFVPIVLCIALLTFGIWWVIDPSWVGLSVAIEFMVAVLVIACPCALGLATPAAVAVGAGRGAELGVLFRTGAALEQASHVDTVFFDKTGTLTNGRPDVVKIEPAPGVGADQLLGLAAAVEVGSEHPFARAIVAAAGARGIPMQAVDGFLATPAMGVSARVGGTVVHVGKPEWLAAVGVLVATASATRVADLAARGFTPLLVAKGGRLLGLLGVADDVRPEARATVAQLQGMGLRVGMLSGDRSGVATAVARSLGIDDVAAELLPADKAARLAEAQASGRRVAMVGDGVNDAPALAAADLGIALGTGTDVAAAAADVALMRGVAGVPVALRLARATMRTIRRNLVWASIYNLAGIPVAAGVFTGFGIHLSPVYASAAMSLSSVSVLLSSLWLRRFRGVGTAGER